MAIVHPRPLIQLAWLSLYLSVYQFTHGHAKLVKAARVYLLIKCSTPNTFCLYEKPSDWHIRDCGISHFNRKSNCISTYTTGAVVSRPSLFSFPRPLLPSMTCFASRFTTKITQLIPEYESVVYGGHFMEQLYYRK